MKGINVTSRIIPLLILILSWYSHGKEPDVVSIETDRGVINIELLPHQAPVSVANFLRYVEQGYYDDTIFHRVIPGFMIQGGGFTEQLSRKPTLPPINNESAQTPRNERGTVAFARTSAPNSATSQFFINVADNPFLNHQPGKPGYAVFGKVVTGMDIVNLIAATPTTRHQRFANLPVKSVVIKSAEVVKSAKDIELTKNIESENELQSDNTFKSETMVQSATGVKRTSEAAPAVH